MNSGTSFPRANCATQFIKDTWSGVSTHKYLSVLMQFAQYLVVGGVAFICDFGVMYLSLQANIHYLLATCLGFCVGLTCNFLLCINWVWRGTKATTAKDFAIFAVIGFLGLLLTAALMWLLVEQFSFYPTWAKAVTACIVLVWNFSLRKIFVFFH